MHGYFEATFDGDDIQIEPITPTLFKTFQSQATIVHLDVVVNDVPYALDFLCSNAPEDMVARLSEISIDIVEDFPEDFR